MKKTISFFLGMSLFLLFVGKGFGNDLVVGQIVANVQNRINIATGDKVMVTVGMKDNVIKGDILQIMTVADGGLMNPVGQCPLLSIKKDSSVCEVTKAKFEIRKGNAVTIPQLGLRDPRLIGGIYRLLYDSSEPYEPPKPIKVYVHNFFDEKNNVTRLSANLKEDVRSAFLQKRKFVVRNAGGKEDLIRLYPDTYAKHRDVIDAVLKRVDADLFVMGSYRIENQFLNIDLYRIDRNFGEEKISFQIPLAGKKDLSDAAEMLVPYDSVETTEYLNCRITHKELQYVPVKEEMKRIIAFETEGNAFKEYDMKRITFNIVSPVDVTIFFDNEKVAFGGHNDFTMPIGKGLHRISASFKRGYFFGNKDSLIYTSDRLVKKEALLDVGKDGNVVVEIVLNPFYGRDTIDFKVYKQVERERIFVRSVQFIESGKNIELFRD